MTPAERKQAWIEEKVASGVDLEAAKSYARALELRGSFGEPTKGAAVEPPAPSDASLAAMGDPRVSSTRAGRDYASEDPGGFSLEVERLKAARDEELRRDQPEMGDAERKRRVQEEADTLRQFPGERAGDIGAMTLNAPAGRLLFGYPTRLDQEETPDQRRKETAREYEALLERAPGPEAALAPLDTAAHYFGVDIPGVPTVGEVWDRSTEAARRVFSGDEEGVPAEAAEAAGFGKTFGHPSDDVGVGRRLVGTMAGGVLGPVEGVLRGADAAAEYFGGDLGDFDIPEVTSGMDLWEQGKRIREDKDVRAITSPSGAADLVKRGATKFAYDTAVTALSDPRPEGVKGSEGDSGVISREDAKRMRDVLAESKYVEAFDSLEGADDEALVERLSALAPRALPEGLAKLPSVERARRALEEEPELRGVPGLDVVARYLDEGRDEEAVTGALRNVPIATLRRLDPASGVTVAEAKAALKRRAKAREETGGEAAASLEKVVGSALLRKEGDRYVPTTFADAMRLAGLFEEAVVEADVGVGDVVPYVPALWPLAAAVKLGASDDVIRKFEALRLPTKRGLDTMLAGDAYDDLVERWGLGPYRAAYEPGERVSYLARVLTNTTLPEAQGAGYRDVALRAGLGEDSPVAALLGAFDVGFDFLVPFEEMVGGPVAGVARAGVRASRASRLMPAGYGLRGAFAGAAPALWMATNADALVKMKKAGKAYEDLEKGLDAEVKAGTKTKAEADKAKALAVTFRDADAPTAVFNAVELSLRESLMRGADPASLRLTGGSDITEQINEVLRVAGADPEKVTAGVRDYSTRARALYMDTLGEMLRAKGTPEQVKLREDPEYKRVQGEIEEYVKAGNLRDADVPAKMAILEVAAHVAAANPDTGIASPADFFKRLHYRVGGEAGPGAMFSRDQVALRESWKAAQADIQSRHGLDTLHTTLRPEDGVLTLDLIRVPKERRGAGVAQAAMKDILRWADENGVTLALTPSSDFGASKARLEKWYRSLGFESNKGRSRDFRMRETMRRTPRDAAPGSTPDRTRAAVEASPEFKAWFGGSKVVDDAGKPLVVYHGTQRPDRIGNKFDPKRATSGPMAFFTNDPSIASGYATNKADTSLPWPEDYSEWFVRRQKGNRRPLNLRDAWWHMTPEERAEVARVLPRVGETDDGEIVLTDDFGVTGRETWEQAIRRNHGNVLAAAQYVWLDGGTLFNDEARFLEVLDKAGVKGFDLNDPNMSTPGVYPVYLAIKNPLNTATIPPETLAALEAASRRTRKRAASAGTDSWDKTTQDPREWMRQLREEYAGGVNSYVWTSIPDWVTRTLRDLGYDGIADTGGKGGGVGHTVYIPFDPTQIKSATGNRGTFDPTDPNILHSEEGGVVRGSIERAPDDIASMEMRPGARVANLRHLSDAPHGAIIALHDRDVERMGFPMVRYRMDRSGNRPRWVREGREVIGLPDGGRRDDWVSGGASFSMPEMWQQVKSVIGRSEATFRWGDGGAYGNRGAGVLYSRDGDAIHGSIERTARHPLDETPDAVGPLRLGMDYREAEKAIRGEANEHLLVVASDGRHLGRFAGDAGRVDLGPALRPNVGGALLTHNHPAVASLSGGDLALAIRHDIGEVRAVLPSGDVYVLRRPVDGWVDRDALVARAKELHDEAVTRARRRGYDMIRAAGGDPAMGRRAIGYDQAAWERLLSEEHTNGIREFLASHAADAEYVHEHADGTVEVLHAAASGRSPPTWGVLLGRRDDPGVRVDAGGRAPEGDGGVRSGHEEFKPLAPTFYSALRKAVEALKGERFSADQLRATLRNAPGVKADEIEWTGLDGFLKGNPKPTKAEVLDWLDENAVVVEEKTLGTTPPKVGDTPAMESARQQIEEIVAQQNALDTRLDAASSPEEAAILMEQMDALRVRRDDLQRTYDNARRAAPIDYAPTQYASYTLPGGANYREILFKRPVEAPYATGLPEGWSLSHEYDRMEQEYLYIVKENGERVGWGTTPRNAIERAARETGEDLSAVKLTGATASTAVPYRAPHFGTEGENLLAHARVNDRVGANGEKILFIEELQSDLHQAGRERGYQGTAEWDEVLRLRKEAERAHDEAIRLHTAKAPTAEVDAAIDRSTAAKRAADEAYQTIQRAVPPAPFSKSWHELALKRLLRLAAEGGYDGIAWTPGIVQVKRYEDATRAAVDEVRWRRAASDEMRLIRLPDGHRLRLEHVYESQPPTWVLYDPNWNRLHSAPTFGDAVDGARASEEQKNAWRAALPASGAYEVVGLKNGREVYRETMAPEKVADVLGKGMAAKIAESPDASGSLTGGDLTIGGEGMKGFYDRILPQFLDKYTKKWGGRVGETAIRAEKVAEWQNVETDVARALEAARAEGDTDRVAGLEESLRDIRARQHVQPVHYLPLTPQMRDAVLYEGQPLFARTGPTIHGSIEPGTAASYLIRLFETGDVNTLLHENAHALRFIFGDSWLRDLVQHFPSEVGPNGQRRLTRPTPEMSSAEANATGEERVAEALRWYLRTRTHPNGKVRAMLDDVYVALQNWWLRRRGGVLPPAMAAKWDATLRPDEPLRPTAVSVVETALVDDFPTVRVASDAKATREEDLVARAGRKREALRVGTRPEDVRTALGLGAKERSHSSLDLYAKAAAYVATERFRRGWGLEEPVRLTARTVVPKSRVSKVAADVRGRVRTALGVDPSALSVVDGVLDLDPPQLAGLRTLAQEAIDSPMGAHLPRAVVDGTAPWTLETYNAVVETLLDHHAGVASRRDRRAESIPQSVGHALVKALTAPLANTGIMADLRQAFVVPKMGEGYVDPQVQEVFEGLGRDLSRAPQDVLNAAKAAKAGDAEGALLSFLSSLTPSVEPQAGSSVRELRGLLEREPDVPTVFASLDTIQSTLAAGDVPLSPAEFAALTALRQVEETFALTDPAHVALFADAAGVLHDGLRRRWLRLEEDAGDILVAFSGSRDRTILEKRTPEEMVKVYSLFYGGEWDELFAFVSNLGHTTKEGGSFDPPLAMAQALVRLQAKARIRDASRRLAAIGIGEVGGKSTDPAFLDRVQHYIEAETSWNAVNVVERGTGTVVRTPPAPTGGHDLEAYTVAHRALASWGFKYGKGSQWGRLLLPDGQEVLAPKMITDELKAAMDRVAPVGTAWKPAPGVAQAVDTLTRIGAFTLWQTKVGMTTGIGLPNPAYYVGNAFGGLMQMVTGLGAARTVEALTSNPSMVKAVVGRLWGEEGAYRPTANPVVTSDGRIYTADSVEDLARREGLSSSFVAAESQNSLADDLRRLNPSFFNTMMKGPRAWQGILTNVATGIDNFYRVSTFVDALRRGESPAAAAELARKVGFDYGAMTDFEKKIARNVVMFYSFQRRNLDLFYDALLSNPSRVLGQLRLLRGANQYFLDEDGELVEPSYLDGRLILAARSAANQGRIAHDKGDVITMAPMLGIVEALNLHADLFDMAAASAGLRGGGSAIASDFMIRLNPYAQILPVVASDFDFFAKRELQSYSRVPGTLVELDRMTTGGIVVDYLLGVQQAKVWDPASEEAPGEMSWHAQNAKRWWLYHTVIQLPGTGRSIDTLATLDRANTGIVEAMITAARYWNPPGGEEPGSGDTLDPRAGIGEPGEFAPLELAGLFAIKSVALDQPATAKDRLYKDRKREAKEATKAAEVGSP